MHYSLCLFRISLLDISGCFTQPFFHLGDKKASLVALDRCSSYAVTIVREFAWVDSAFVLLQRWLFEQV